MVYNETFNVIRGLLRTDNYLQKAFEAFERKRDVCWRLKDHPQLVLEMLTEEVIVISSNGHQGDLGLSCNPWSRGKREKADNSSNRSLHKCKNALVRLIKLLLFSYSICSLYPFPVQEPSAQRGRPMTQRQLDLLCHSVALVYVQ